MKKICSGSRLVNDRAFALQKYLGLGLGLGLGFGLGLTHIAQKETPCFHSTNSARGRRPWLRPNMFVFFTVACKLFERITMKWQVLLNYASRKEAQLYL